MSHHHHDDHMRSHHRFMMGLIGYLSALALGIFVTNAWLINATQLTQAQVNDRQAQINQGVQLSQLNNELVRALGTAVIAQKDDKIKDLLAAHGITVSPEKAAAPAAAKPAGK